MLRLSVVLPEPDSPTTATHSPRCTSKPTSRTMVTAVARVSATDPQDHVVVRGLAGQWPRLGQHRGTVNG